MSPSVDRARPRVKRTDAPGVSKFRAARTVGLRARSAAAAAALLAVLILIAALATGGRGSRLVEVGDRITRGAVALAGDARGLLQGGVGDLGPPIAAVHLQGATRAAQDEILRAAGVHPGDPILGLDLEAIRARVERVGWVDHARVMRLFPDTVVIAVTQRPLMAVWQIGGHRYVVATNGRLVTAVDPADFRGLPVIIGAGANTEAATLLPLILARPRLAERVAAIRRVDTRRWDILLKDHGVVLLPATGEAAALQRLDRLDQSAGVLGLGLARIDLRAANFSVVRPGEGATAATVSHGV